MTPSRKDKTIVLFFASEQEHEAMLPERQQFRDYLVEMYQQHPELFPAGFEEGFHFIGFVTSKKLSLKMRRIRLKSNNESYQIRPSFAMPYMIGKTEQVEKALFLRLWGVPFWALAYLFGHDAMFWYRAFLSLGRNNLVGTTIKCEQAMPKHILIDEKHGWYFKVKAYIATVAAHNCFLGAALCFGADEVSLTEGYGTFASELKEINPTYQPKTVNCDGWEATKNAIIHLFPQIEVILCFFHAWLSIRKRCRREKSLLSAIGERVWDAYNASTLPKFAQRIRRLREWAEQEMYEGIVREKVLALCKKVESFKAAYLFYKSYRTSNALDRLMDYQDRQLYAMRSFSGSVEATGLYLRSSALLWNFHPYQKGLKEENVPLSPFEELNGFRYHDNWLHNLLIASSLKGNHVLLKKS